MGVSSTGIVVLAAGASSRLGQPKQLLPYKDKKLITHIIDTALETKCTPIVVVLGANASLIQPQLLNLSVQIIQNEQWEEGMASSIRCGLSAILQIAPTTDGVLFTVCDQPFVSAALLKSLNDKHIETGKGIVASTYDNTLGTPVFFAKQFFPNLLQLTGKEGAKKIIEQHLSAVEAIPFPTGGIDIDTAKDYENLQQTLS